MGKCLKCHMISMENRSMAMMRHIVRGCQKFFPFLVISPRATMATAAVIYGPAHPMTVARDMSIAGEEEVTALDVT